MSKKSLEEIDGIGELDLIKQWADRSIVCPPDFGHKQEVDKAYKLIKDKLIKLKGYENKNGTN